MKIIPNVLKGETMKKIIAMLMSAMLSIGLLAGCGNQAKEEAGTDSSVEAGTKDSAAETSTQEAAAETAGETKDYTGVELVVCTWGGTTGEATKKMAEDFEKKYGCTVVIDEVNANSDRIAKLQAQEQSGVIEDDVVYLSGAYAKTGESMDLFEKIDTNVVTSTDELYDFAKNDSGYGPMVCAGRFGIMYNANILAEKGLEPPTSYMELFDDQYAGLVALPAMTATAGPYVLAAIAEDLGGGLDNYQAALDLYAEKKNNINLWYTTELISALTQKEAAITVYMDLMMPVLQGSGLNMKWVDAEEGNFADDVYINVVKEAPNKELAQLFIEYTLQKESQEKFLQLNSEAPTNKTAAMSEEQDAYLVYGQEEFDNCTFFDYSVLNDAKPALIEEWQKIVAR